MAGDGPRSGFHLISTGHTAVRWPEIAPGYEKTPLTSPEATTSSSVRKHSSVDVKYENIQNSPHAKSSSICSLSTEGHKLMPTQN